MNKTCSSCEQTYLLCSQAFPPRKNSSDGFEGRCRQCKRSAAARYRNSDRGKAINAAYAKEWRSRNEGYWVDWRSKNPRYHKDWHQARPGYVTEKWREWIGKMPEKDRKMFERAHTAKRRAAIANAQGAHSAHDIKKALDSQKNKCWWCGTRLHKAYHVDHRIPLARGGGNGPGNIVMSCPPCNQARGSKLPWEMARGPRLL